MSQALSWNFGICRGRLWNLIPSLFMHGVIASDSWSRQFTIGGRSMSALSIEGLLSQWRYGFWREQEKDMLIRCFLFVPWGIFKRRIWGFFRIIQLDPIWGRGRHFMLQMGINMGVCRGVSVFGLHIDWKAAIPWVSFFASIYFLVRDWCKSDFNDFITFFILVKRFGNSIWLSICFSYSLIRRLIKLHNVNYNWFRISSINKNSNSLGIKNSKSS